MQTWRAVAPTIPAFFRLRVTRLGGNRPGFDPEAAANSTQAPFLIRDSETVFAGEAENEGYGLAGDSLLFTFVGGTHYTGGQLLTNAPGIDALAPHIATLDANNRIVRQSDGIGVFAATQAGLTTTLSVDVTLQGASVSSGVFDRLLTGTLAWHMDQQIRSRLPAEPDLLTHTTLFSTLDHVTPEYVRNADFWGADLDWSAIAARAQLDPARAGRLGRTLITPRHVIFAWHYTLMVGTTPRPLLFVEADGTMHERFAIRQIPHPNYGLSLGPFNDLGIAVLDEALPEGVQPMQVWPADWRDYVLFPRAFGDLGVWSNRRPLAWGGNQFHRVSLRAERSAPSQFDRPLVGDPARELYESLIMFDSGQPGGHVYDGAPVVSTVWTYGGPGSGTLIAEHIETLNQMIRDVDLAAGVSGITRPDWPNDGTHYQLSTPDWSVWPRITDEPDWLLDTVAWGAWKELPPVNGRPAYRLRLDSQNYSLLTWSGTAWQIEEFVNSVSTGVTATATGDTPTPLGADFGEAAAFVLP